MRTVRFLVPLAVATLGLLVLPSVANAVPYPVGSPQLTIENATPSVNTSDNPGRGSGFAAGETVSITVVTSTAIRRPGETMVPVAYTAPDRRAAVTVIADANGDFTVALTFTQVGLAVVTASGPVSASASITVRVLPAGAALPVTGQSGTVLGIALVGSVIAAGGAVLLVLFRSRRRRIGNHSS